MDIKKLAEREKIAEANRKTADAEWRQAWWETTWALGGISDTLKRKAAVNMVAKVMGSKSSSYASSRARAGGILREAGIPKRKASKMPPRMTLEVVRVKGQEITEELVDQVIQAEADGTTLRKFAEGLTGKAWADTPAGASPETSEQIVRSQPRLVGQLVAQHEEASRAHDSEVLSHHDRTGREHVPPEDWSSSKHSLTRLTLAVKELRRECDKPGDLTENARATIEWALAELTAIKEGRDFVGEVESWLEGNTV